MSKLFAALAAVVFFAAGCAVDPISGNPRGAPLSWQGVTLTNGCMADAIECCTKLKDSGAEAQILLIKYEQNGAFFGHAMTRYYWPPRFGADGKQRMNAYSVPYVYDAQNASTALPPRVDPGNATSVATYAIPGTVKAAWADQTPYQDRQDR